MLAQKVPLRPPPFLLQEEGTKRDADTNTQKQKHKDMSDLIKMWCSGSDGLSEGGPQSEMSQFD